MRVGSDCGKTSAVSTANFLSYPSRTTRSDLVFPSSHVCAGLQAEAKENERYKVLFCARHGLAYHNWVAPPLGVPVSNQDLWTQTLQYPTDLDAGDSPRRQV
jgi:hypothetical protein